MKALLGHAVLPLTSGSLLYLGFRSERLLGWRWAEALGLAELGRALRTALSTLALPDWVRFTLPDALWVYALTYALSRLSRGAIERSAWMSVALALGPGAELGQLGGLVPGTFDPADLIATSLAFGAALASSTPAVHPALQETT